MKTEGTFLFAALVMIFVQGSDSSQAITQSPRTLPARLTETVTLSCKTGSGVGSDLSWYLQKPGQPPKLLFYSISTRASGTPSHYSSSGSEPDYSLTINGVTAADVGEFFCFGDYGGGVFTR
uniref:Ig-like domain-containing protein n=1 Tax=Neogobius melanostomus TaxID=47308 RepID=A0A8C6V2L5_9GOBI